MYKHFTKYKISKICDAALSENWQIGSSYKQYFMMPSVRFSLCRIENAVIRRTFTAFNTNSMKKNVWDKNNNNN